MAARPAALELEAVIGFSGAFLARGAGAQRGRRRRNARQGTRARAVCPAPAPARATGGATTHGAALNRALPPFPPSPLSPRLRLPPGKVQNGLQWHPNGTHLVYALGSTVIIKSLVDGAQSFLTGHTGVVSALALSACGRFIASGQQSLMGKKVRRPGGGGAHARQH
jgi:hypothetical protein